MSDWIVAGAAQQASRQIIKIVVVVAIIAGIVGFAIAKFT